MITSAFASIPFMKTKAPLAACALVVFLILPTPGYSQWITQHVQLVPGWNAVYLEVQPEPRECNDVFRDTPVESVWKWDRRFSTIQFAVDPETLLPESPDWLVWLPASDPRAFLNRLFGLQGCQSYLIKVATNATPFTLNIKGRVAFPRLDWYPHGLNLVGLPVHPNNPPTFAEFFRVIPEVNISRGFANELYKVDSQGRSQRIVQPARERIQPGVAYWIGCSRAPANQAVLSVTPPSGTVDFGTWLVREDITLRNIDLTKAHAIRMILRNSESPPPTGDYPELAGPVPLSYLSRDSSNQWAWSDFPATGLSQSLAPGEAWVIPMGVRRSDFEPYTPHGTNGAAYQSKVGS